MFKLKCIKCGEEYPPEEVIVSCPKDGGLLEVRLDISRIEVTKREILSREMGLWRYRDFMPVREGAKIVTLQEGGTPLYKSQALAKEVGVKELYVKNEGANPSGSFKDRGMTMGVTKALELKVSAVGCASTGNTSASLAAYGAKAKIKTLVLLPAGKIAMGKLAQAILHGATVVGIKANFDVALRMVREASERFNIYLLNSINPWRLEGQKSEAFEMVDQLGWEAPDRVVVPVGNCGNISAMWKGFREFKEYGFIDRLPKMTGIQAEGASPVVRAFKEGRDEIVPFESPDTVATAIRIGAPVNAPKALKALKESGGIAESVTDEEILEAQKLFATTEGVGVEPASASSIAGLKRLVQEGRIDPEERIVCVTTGHALKDPETIFNYYKKPIEIEPDLEELAKILER